MTLKVVAKRVYRVLTWPERMIRTILVWHFLPSASTRRFGFQEALAFSSSVDIWQRYSVLAAPIKKAPGSKVTVLDIGAGGVGISAFLTENRYEIYLLDRDENRLAMAPLQRTACRIVADACTLPFRDEAFDFVVSCDNLEHIPTRLRPQYYLECQRVARNQLLIHVPAVSQDGSFRGDHLDQRFQRLHKRIFLHEEQNVAEHIENGLPSVEELQGAFPGASLRGRTNGRIWVWYMLLERIPYVRLFAGVLYLLFKRSKDHTPPYYACFLSWRKK